MNQWQRIDAAQTIVGEHATNDYVLAPITHAERLADDAPDLARILRMSDVAATAREFEHWDEQALEAQRRFQKWSSRTHWFVFVTICLSAGLVLTGAFSALTASAAVVQKVVIGVLALGCVACGAVASVGFARIRRGHLLEDWMRKRAEAETYRLSYFELITEKRPAAGASKEIPLSLLQLEYFRRYQLDVQLQYYTQRGEDHERAGNRSLASSTWAMGGAVFVNGLAGILGWLEPSWAAIAVLALISQAFASILSNREAINQDRRNAERYERSRTVLARLSGELDRIRTGILDGDDDALAYFVDAVHEQLSLEHRQWIDAFERRISAIGKLEQHLSDFKSAAEPPTG